MSNEENKNDRVLVISTAKTQALQDKIADAEEKKKAADKKASRAGLGFMLTGVSSVLGCIAYAMTVPPSLGIHLIVGFGLPTAFACMLGQTVRESLAAGKCKRAAKSVEKIKQEFAEEASAATARLQAQAESAIDRAFKDTGHLTSGQELPFVSEDGRRKIIYIQSFECGTAMLDGKRVSTTTVNAQIHDAASADSNSRPRLAADSLLNIQRIYHEELKM